MKHGAQPEVIGNYPIEVDEMMLYLYMPICTPDDTWCVENMPERLKPFEQLVFDATEDSQIRGENFDYWYITAKRQYVTPDNMGNRHGWHSDGYGTDDVNYVWADCVPTQFAIQQFYDLSPDHNESLRQMAHQANEVYIEEYDDNTLLRLDQFNVHRIAESDYRGMRTFFKLTGSNSRFNLKGNTHNYLMNYNWPMFNRKPERNMEAADAIKPKLDEVRGNLDSEVDPCV